ncbi:beta-glucan synthesis-associated protein [Tilletia horrida]|nr:beta-glucan synthesis-associated protein [Tilletia horrida]
MSAHGLGFELATSNSSASSSSAASSSTGKKITNQPPQIQLPPPSVFTSQHRQPQNQQSSQHSQHSPLISTSESGRNTPLMDLHYQIASGRETPIDWTPPSPRAGTPDSGLSPRLTASAFASRRYGSGSLASGSNGGNTSPASHSAFFQPRSGLSHRHPGPEPPGTPEPLAFSAWGNEQEKTGQFSGVEDDDALHDPHDANEHSKKVGFRGALNILTLIIIAAGLLSLFAGYPIISYSVHLRSMRNTLQNGINIGGTNGSGQIPDLDIRKIIDPHTTSDAYTFISQGVDQTLKATNKKYNLVFSDEFNEEGRTFWPGDDPFWEAVDIWYGATQDYEWYSPEAINTTGGNLVIALEAMEIHNLNFRSGMLQSWNKFCYQGGYIEFSMLQPGDRETMGYWPALWMMGNLGRPGYLGSTEGLWPYSYDSCDTGIVSLLNVGSISHLLPISLTKRRFSSIQMPKQLYWNESGPIATVHGTGQYSKAAPDDPNGPKRLSHLPGMRFPACTCPGEDHPGPNVNVGRSAAELDVIESQIQFHHNQFHSYASQSMQTAPFDAGYFWHNETDVDYHIYNDTISTINNYVGGPLQECTSGLTQVPDDGFELNGERYIKYGVEYQPDWDGNGNAFVTWYVDDKPSWTVFGSALGPRPEQDIGQRLIPVEPMSIIMNLGMAPGFQPVRFSGQNQLKIPTSMKVDYVRLYQPDGQASLITCDPADHPTLELTSILL